MTNVVDSSQNRLFAEVAATDNSTQVYADKCKLWKIILTASLSAHTVDITDGTTTVFQIPASTGAATIYDLGGVTMSSLTVDPQDAASAGTIIVVYEPIHDGS